MNSGSSGFQQFMAARESEKKTGASGMLIWMLIAVLAGWLAFSWFAPRKESIEHRAKSIDDAPAQVAVPEVPSQMLMGEAIIARVAGIRISEIELKNYVENDDGNVRLLSAVGEFLEIGFSGAGASVPMPDTLWRINRAIGGDRIYMAWTSPEGVEFRRAITMSTDYVINVSDTATNNSAVPVAIGGYARIVRGQGSEPSARAAFVGGIARAGGSIERESWRSLSRRPLSLSTAAGFVGFTDQYWQTVVGMDAFDKTLRIRGRGDGMFQADAGAEMQSIAPGQTHTWTAHIFAGPKNQSDLSAAAGFMPGIDHTIDYGWFWFLARPFLWAINALHAIVGNYGVAIILFTILLRMIMWPLTKKSFTAMSNMQKLQPEMQRIQKEYGHDKARMQQEMMKLYTSGGGNPMGGCLPMLLQIPIFFALYKALLISVPMRNADFLWISDLAARDPYFLLPILMGGTMWLQQKLQQAGAASAGASEQAAQMQKMMKWLPVIFTVMFSFMPAGLVLYWTVSNVFGIGQMYIIKKRDVS